MLSGSNHTWSGSATIRAGKQSFLALSKSLFLPRDTHHTDTLLLQHLLWWSRLKRAVESVRYLQPNQDVSSTAESKALGMPNSQPSG